jgi:ketosteroid isomerase-like protein
MSARTDTVEAYFEAFGRSDHDAVLVLLTEDVIWDIPGHMHLRGREAFDAEIENPGFDGSPTLDIDRLLEDGDSVVALGQGATTRTTGEVMRFAFCDVFTFRERHIARVESYLGPLD